MPNITIREQDLTVANYNIEVADVAFIPGFVNSDVAPAKNLAPAMTPIYCETLDAFKAAFGSVAPAFKVDQSYEYAQGQSYWSPEAIPDSKIMLTAGSSDYGYLLAVRILGMGIPVIYTRVNADIGKIIGSGPFADIPIATASDLGNIYMDTDTNQYYECVYDSDDQEYMWQLTHFGEVNEGITYVNDPDINDLYAAMTGTTANNYEDSIFYSVQDPGAFNVKYMTSGGYPTFEYNQYAPNKIVDLMLKVVADMANNGRGDCVAIIDHTNNPERSLDPTNTNSVYYSVNNAPVFTSNNNMNEYGTMFTPWCEYTVSDGTSVVMAGSYGYLTSLAASLASNGNWLAIAGVNRGRPPYIVAPYTSNNILTNKIADEYSSMTIAINAITEIKPYGYTIWGNRTLKDNGGILKATSYLNIRNMVSDIKKVAYSASRSLMFEQNNEILWINFKAKVSPLLDKLVSGHGIEKYSMKRLASTDRTKLVALITIYPTYAVESFDITIELKDDDSNN